MLLEFDLGFSHLRYETGDAYNLGFLVFSSIEKDYTYVFKLPSSLRKCRS